ncbi:MAG: ArsR/SmtB family transcription factor [Desulfotignum sp.]
MKKTHQSLPSDENISRMVEIFKALSDPTRLKIVLSLLNREHCVCDIAVLCGQSDSAVSHQLRILRTLKIVKNRREGKIMYYSINDDHVVSLIQMSLAHVTHG